ncbi:NRDE family protein [Tahibacter amnicola]|uniref:NRDE family protein n=1 Tax=Tahibacter amnicola TaxID=2976241 RepID=A0ABY6BAW4_9GAMM|nr:NRDE family protein [Tahibacter amnicola]UXI67206.1 NRDE family protein [Tahibacter amnicola]
MCLLLLAHDVVPGRPLVWLANRDEFHPRPSAAAAPWGDAPGVVGGRDLEAGGSWLALHTSGRFAAVTNIRMAEPRRGPRSRGDLVRDFVAGGMTAKDYIAELALRVEEFAPFNLVVADTASAWCLESPRARASELTTGVHVISNGPLDAPWPKMERIRALFETAVQTGDDDAALLDLLADDYQPPDAVLPDTGVGIALERFLGSIFIRGERYGTRASTLAWRNGDGTTGLRERSYGPEGVLIGEVAL